MSGPGPGPVERLAGLSDRLREQVGRPLFDADEERGLDARLRRGPLGASVRDGARQLVPRKLRMFPFTAPSWPGSVSREPDRSSLGMNYDTDWARDPWARAVRRIVNEGVLRPGVELLAAPTVAGLDRIDGVEGPVIFAPNHLSHIDIMLMLTRIPSRFRRRVVAVAAADYFFDTRMKAVLSALAIGAIPMERKKVSRTSSDRALEMLREGWSIIIFPEGGRSPDGWAGEFKPGAAFLSTRTGVPVVPVHLEGTGRVLPKGASLPSRGSTTVTFGFPMYPAEGEDPRKMNTRLSDAVAQLADEQANGWWVARRNAANNNTPSLQGPQGQSWRREWTRTAGDEARTAPKRSWP